MQCRNCHTIFEGNYCPECGQKHNSGRIILKESVAEIVDHWLGLDTPFLKTVIGLTRNPGRLIKSYIAGSRKSISHPFRYFIVVLALYLITRELIVFNPITAFQSMMTEMGVESQGSFTNASSEFFSRHINSFLIIYAFTLSGFAKLLNFRKSMYFMEYLVTSFFTISQYILFATITIPLTLIDVRFFLLNYILVFVYPVIVLIQIMEGSLLVKFTKSIAISILGWFSYSIIGFSLADLIVRMFNL